MAFPIALGAQALLSLLQVTRSIISQVDIATLVDSEEFTPEQQEALKQELLAERDAVLAEWERLAPPAE